VILHLKCRHLLSAECRCRLLARSGVRGFIVGRYWSGMVVVAFRSHFAGPEWFLNVASPISVKLWSTHCWSRFGPGAIPVQYQPASFCTMCASSPIPDQYWPSVLDGDGCSPIPDKGYDLAPSPTHTAQFLNRRRGTSGSAMGERALGQHVRLILSHVTQGAPDDDMRQETVRAHAGRVTTIQHSPFFGDIILTVGGYTFALWRAGCERAPLMQSRNAVCSYTTGCWSPARPGATISAHSLGHNIEIVIKLFHYSTQS
jgi:hypothetical protein